jgi:hypothetical protein
MKHSGVLGVVDVGVDRREDGAIFTAASTAPSRRTGHSATLRVSSWTEKGLNFLARPLAATKYLTQPLAYALDARLP